MSCVFCEIINGKKPREIISETNPSQIKGHCLVIPKRHITKLSELYEFELKELIKEVVKIEEKLLKNFSGCDIKQNYRPFIPDSKFKVSHLHFHIQPRELNDELFHKVQNNEKNVFKDLNIKEMEEIKKELF